jgi:hypothetical protein
MTARDSRIYGHDPGRSVLASGCLVRDAGSDLALHLGLEIRDDLLVCRGGGWRRCRLGAGAAFDALE